MPPSCRDDARFAHQTASLSIVHAYFFYPQFWKIEQLPSHGLGKHNRSYIQSAIDLKLNGSLCVFKQVSLWEDCHRVELRTQMVGLIEGISTC